MSFEGELRQELLALAKEDRRAFEEWTESTIPRMRQFFNAAV
jgi:hypothetical protein